MRIMSSSGMQAGQVKLQQPHSMQSYTRSFSSSACPMGLEPWLLNKLSRAGGRFDELEKERVFDCIECGCCSFTCPAQIPLVDMIRISKAEVMKIMRSRPKK